jgi:CubicO group peptidase (beta-lactamase class C family)
MVLSGRTRTIVTLAALAIWLLALAGRHLGLVGGSFYSAATLVSVMLIAVVCCALASGLLRVWARRHAYRAFRAARLPRASTGRAGGAPGTLAMQAIAATGSVGCAAVFVSGIPGTPRWGSVYSAAGRSVRRRPEIGPDTRFEIGSLTKIFTGLILADMAVRKEVDLDMPAGALLGVHALGAVTLRSLATHTSGLPRRATGPRLMAVLALQPDPHSGIGLDHVIAALARHPPPVPGQYRYSNVGYQLLGAALATVAGTAWPDLLEQRVCGPLGLTATGVGPDEHTARGHDKAGLPHPYLDYALFPGALGMSSTTADLDRFLCAQLDPETTPLGSAIRLSRAVHTPPSALTRAGLGWRLKTSGDAALAWHGGLTGGFSAFAAVLDRPGAHRGLAILANGPYAGALQTVGLGTLLHPAATSAACDQVR